MNHSMAIAARDRRLLRRDRSVSAKFTSLAKLAAILLSLVVLGLNIPKLSTLLFLLLVLLFARPRLEFLEENVLLLLFSVAYFGISSSYGEIPLSDAIKYIIMGQSAYCLGVYIRWNRLPFWPYSSILAVVAFGTGMFFFGYLSFELTLVSYAYLIPKRSFVAFWSGETGNAIAMIDYCGVIIALIPAAIITLTRLPQTRLAWLKRIPLAMVSCGFILLGIEGLRISAFFRNRGPVVMLAIVAAASILYYLWRQGFLSSAKTLLFSLGLGFTMYLLLSNAIDIETPLGLITDRFAHVELESSRYYMWGEGLKSLIANPFGGVVVNRVIFGDGYFHCFWLDVARCAGILPLFFLVIFQIKHVYRMVKIIRHARNILLEIITLSLGLCMLFVYMEEPVIAGGLAFWFFNLFIFGIISYLGKEIAVKQEQSRRKEKGRAGPAPHSRAHGFTMAGRGIPR
jgi:hypothetical protein